jgi:hypothetical protein
MRHLQAYTLSRGFITSTKSFASKSTYFIYIYYPSRANTRGLEDHIQKDKKGNIVSKRKKEAISINGKDYI